MTSTTASSFPSTAIDLYRINSQAVTLMAYVALRGAFNPGADVLLLRLQDLYNIIQHPSLFPERTVKSAGYDPVTPTELDRPCTIEDVIDFFLIFIQTDRIGAIAERHLCLADRSPKGVEDYQCIKLAAQAAIAVDYQKSGVAPDWRR